VTVMATVMATVMVTATVMALVAPHSAQDLGLRATASIPHRSSARKRSHF
jgi:hypothetical protein